MKCAIGQLEMSTEVRNACYCYADPARGLRDATVCPSCLLKHVRRYFGADAPTVRHLLSHYADGIPSCDGTRLPAAQVPE